MLVSWYAPEEEVTSQYEKISGKNKFKYSIVCHESTTGI